MNRIKRNIIGVFICALMLFLPGCNNQIPDDKTDSQPKPNLANVLTRVEIEKALSEKGFHPTKVLEDDGTYKRNDITPIIYYYNNTDAIILYDFSYLNKLT